MRAAVPNWDKLLVRSLDQHTRSWAHSTLREATNNYFYGQTSPQGLTFTLNGLMLVNSSKIQQIPIQTMMESTPLMTPQEMKTEAPELNRTVSSMRLLKGMKTLRGTITDGGPNEGDTASRIDYSPASECHSIMAFGIHKQISRTTPWPRNYVAKYLRWLPDCARMYSREEDDNGEYLILESSFPMHLRYFISLRLLE